MKILCAQTDAGVTFAVRVVPRASQSEVVGEHDGALRVRVAALPIEGAANSELIKTLARFSAWRNQKSKSLTANLQSINASRLADYPRRNSKLN